MLVSVSGNEPEGVRTLDTLSEAEPAVCYSSLRCIKARIGVVQLIRSSLLSKIFNQVRDFEIRKPSGPRIKR